jgi:small-conductance mechanosensitive channel
MIPLGIALATAGAAFAVAFGLGGREVARELSAGRSLRGVYAPGQEISVGGVRGTVRGVESTFTVLDAGDGRTLRVPNYVLLDNVVTVHDE